MLEFAHQKNAPAVEPPPLPPDFADAPPPVPTGTAAPASHANLLDPLDDESGALDALGPVAPPPKPVAQQAPSHTKWKTFSRRRWFGW